MGIANEDETKLAVTGYVRVTNGSGEVYDNAQTRLVVGKINLVEKIADLARRPPPGPPAPQNLEGQEIFEESVTKAEAAHNFYSFDGLYWRGTPAPRRENPRP